MSSPTPDAPTGRLRSLDGLRGIAALAVVFHHLFLAAPVLLNTIWPPPGSAVVGLLWRSATFPVHLAVSAGLEAVFLFFVLSGLVLTLPALRNARHYNWFVYYPQRLLRLYLPVVASVVLAVVLLLLVPRYALAGKEAEWLSSTNSLAFSWNDVFATLNVFGLLHPLDNPLWSLGWEILFSILLPLGVLIAVGVRRRPLLLAVLTVLVATAATTVGAVLAIDALIYLPMFLVGVALAASIRQWGAVIEPLSTLAKVLLFVVSLLLIASPWILSIVRVEFYQYAEGVAVLGCALLVLLAVYAGWVRRGLEWRPVQWLGRVSFSLYLVHVPVIVTIAYLVGPERWQLFMPLGLPISLLVAWGFYLVAERSSHRFARFVGSRIAAARA